MLEKQKKMAIVIDVAIPNNGNIRNREHEKLKVLKVEGRT